MIITASEIRNDTYHFFSKQIGKIFLISIFVTFVSILTDMFVKPDMNVVSIIENNQLIHVHSFLDLINKMNLEEKNQLLKYSIFKIVELLLSKTLLLGSMIVLISNLSNNKKESIISSAFSLFTSFPNLFLLNFLVTFLVQLAFMFFIILGILLSILLSLAPIIFSFKQHNLIESIRFSMRVSWKHIKIIGSGVLFWMFSKFIITTMLSSIDFLNRNLIFLILHMSINVLYSLLIIYLFRFYMIFLRSQNSNVI
ncbi:YciC family protein [Buchnera aphidicola]|uniref:UPF0259 membrane protein D9V70_01410 n=1 Tax=Buchnera aphidicola (Lipaphis pseudobrassicae) TaxID=1258543 RepID=A0A4D6Y7A4_9GAMM|nr:YciC family protein [Buchnera aphidicola]QCI22138.1 UPF0259 family protein [Buchnera aphidicola (Lipaphis pseudobrassicae)]